MRRLVPTAIVLVLAACAAEPRPLPPVPKTLEGMPAEAAPTAAPATMPPTAPAPASNAERYAQERGRWRLALTLDLPALPAATARRIRHASMLWLFEGLAAPGANGFAAAGAAAHERLILESPVPADAAAAWYEQRGVTGVQVGPWLSLARSMDGFAGGTHPNQRLDGLIVEADTARALLLDEIVPPERQAALRAVLAAALRTAKGIPAGQPLTPDILRDEDLPIPVPLLSTGDARFVWNRYDIAESAAGVFTVTLPAEQVRGMFTLDPWKKP